LTDVAWLGFEDKLYWSNETVDTIISRWFEIRPISGGKVKKVAPKKPEEDKENDSNDEFEEDYDMDELLADRLEDIFAEAETRAPANMGQHLRYISGYSLKEVGGEIRKLDNEMDQVRQQKPSQKKTEELYRIETKRRFLEKKRAILERVFELYRHDMIDLPNVKPLVEQLKAEAGPLLQPNLSRLDFARRWGLFFEVVLRGRVLCAEKAQEIEERLIHEQKKLHEIRRFGEGQLLKSSKVVGMTTTGAAKYHDLVRMMESKIGELVHLTWHFVFIVNLLKN
jgi:hypothetical protein